MTLSSRTPHSSLPLSSPPPSASNPFAAYYAPFFVESKLRPDPPSALPWPACLTYLVSSFVDDGDALKRTLLVLYHPANRYVVHLDLEAPLAERQDLHDFITRHPVFSAIGNVKMITKANLVTYRGPTMVANTLHAAVILLQEGRLGLVHQS